jgi:hypothetical protein
MEHSVMPNKKFTLEDFINMPSESTTVAVSSPKYELINNLNKSITLKDLSLSESKAEKFKKQIVEYVTSPESIKSVSDTVGEPLDNETEDEFVERSLQNITKLLLKKFG